MTTAVDSASRLTVLASGVRVVRLESGDQGWLTEFEPILRISAKDFLKRSGAAGTPEGVLEELAQSLWHPHRAIWLVLTAEYRLLGFALAELRASFGAPPELFTIVAYLYPKRTPREVFPALVKAMLAWGRERGATRGTFQTQRMKPGAWARIGAKPIATVFAIPIAEEAD
jgi:hypothetical protein